MIFGKFAYRSALMCEGTAHKNLTNIRGTLVYVCIHPHFLMKFHGGEKILPTAYRLRNDGLR